MLGIGNCFDNAFHFLTQNRTAFLVHGLATLRCEPFIRYVHAWIELGDICFDVGDPPRYDFIAVHKHRFYQLGKIDEKQVRRYTFDVAVDEAERFGNTGPWHIKRTDEEQGLLSQLEGKENGKGTF